MDPTGREIHPDPHKKTADVSEAALGQCLRTESTAAFPCQFPFPVTTSLFSCADPSHEGTAEGMENMADAVTHARFVGTDPASDEVVLMKILQVSGEKWQLP